MAKSQSLVMAVRNCVDSVFFLFTINSYSSKQIITNLDIALI